jgi:ribosome-binding protein aMBF1 (putative translation factor)
VSDDKEDLACEGCGEKFRTEEETIKHEETCPEVIELEASLREKFERAANDQREEQRKERAEEQEKWKNQLKKDKFDNPHLSLISDYLSNNNDILNRTNEHLGWLALMAKVALVMIVLQFFFLFLLFAG